MKAKFDLLVTGVGGQGVVLASDIIGEVALAAGYDVKKTDTIGMAQRGGSVLSHVRLGQRVYSPLIREGEVDILLAFEKLEAVRWVGYLKSGAVVIINQLALPPLSVINGGQHYPDDAEITSILRQKSDKIYFVDGLPAARELGNVRTLNIYMLGCVSGFLPVEVSVWQEGIARRVPPKYQAVNMAAFDRGRKEIGNGCLR